MSSRFSSIGRAGALALLAATLSACSLTLLPPNVIPEVPMTHSVEEADSKLEKARIDRAAVEARFSAEETVCYNKFFVNDCLDEAKEIRRSALAVVHAVEVEAEYFKRKAEVDARDVAVAASIKAADEEEARLAALPPEPPKAKNTPPAPPRRATLEARKAAQEAKEARIAAQDQAEAPKRVERAAAYQKKRLDLEERQRKVALKQAERAQKIAAKAAADKAAADKAAAAKPAPAPAK